MAPHGRWGRGNDLDFWTAVELGEVHSSEIRAVDLLRRTTDPDRFAYYCQTGFLPAMGNVTGQIYLLLRGGAAIELEDGRPIASWCISIGPHRTDIPGTDHVVVLRNFVEGEELIFLNTGNRSIYTPEAPLWMYGMDEWFPDPYRSEIGDDHDNENVDVLEMSELDQKNGVAAVGPYPQVAVPQFAGIQYLGNNNVDANANINAGVAGHDFYLRRVDVQPLAQIIPNLPPGIGVDLPDGQVIHLNEDLENRLLRTRGIRAREQVDLMIAEGYNPEMILHHLNNTIWVV